jgi:hypothetical protein
MLRENIAGLLPKLTAYPVALTLMIGPGILAWQCYEWLKTARWHPVPVADALTALDITYPVSTWAGLQKIIDAVLDLPLSVVTFVVSIVLAVAVQLFVEHIQLRIAPYPKEEMAKIFGSDIADECEQREREKSDRLDRLFKEHQQRDRG